MSSKVLDGTESEIEEEYIGCDYKCQNVSSNSDSCRSGVRMRVPLRIAILTDHLGLGLSVPELVMKQG